MVVKNTFVHALSTEEANSAAKGLPRASSCPSLVVPPSTSQEYANSEGPAVSPLADLGDWADIDSDDEEEHHPACLPSVGLSTFGFIATCNPAFKGDEKTAVLRESFGAQTFEKVRTPLSTNASAFVPGSQLNGKASAFCPRSCQMVNESLDSPVHGIWWETAKEPHTNTTVILHHLPDRYTRTDLIQTLNDEGFAGLYDFVYVPMDFKTKACKGYSFVNLIDGEQAQHFIDRFHGRYWSSSKSSRACKATPSRLQGLAANITRYQNSPLMSREVPDLFKPALFIGKQQVPFPEPTNMLPPAWRMRPQ